MVYLRISDGKKYWVVKNRYDFMFTEFIKLFLVGVKVGDLEAILCSHVVNTINVALLHMQHFLLSNLLD